MLEEGLAARSCTLEAAYVADPSEWLLAGRQLLTYKSDQSYYEKGNPAGNPLAHLIQHNRAPANILSIPWREVLADSGPIRDRFYTNLH